VPSAATKPNSKSGTGRFASNATNPALKNAQTEGTKKSVARKKNLTAAKARVHPLNDWMPGMRVAMGFA
jgi:hypothetical protein